MPLTLSIASVGGRKPDLRLSDSEIRQKLDLTEWKKLHHFDEQMGGNINKAYLEIEAANF